MATPILKVLTEFCAVYVDDVRLTELLGTDKPLYARQMWWYLHNAIPLFNLPPEMQQYLVGDSENPNFVEPSFAEATAVVDADITGARTFELGQAYSGFEICGCIAKTVNPVTGIMTAVPLAVEYDAENGNVTVSGTVENPIEASTTLSFDFYTDGYFVKDLSLEIMAILGRCFEVVWQGRFNADWLSMVSKTEDKSFFEQNRANKINADTARLQALRVALAEEMRRYEQNLYYKQKVSPTRRIRL